MYKNIKDYFIKAGGIILTLPIIWKLILGDIPLVIAQIIAFLGIFICTVSVVLIYVALNIIRLLVYFECHWFMNLDKEFVTRTIFLSAIIIAIASRIFIAIQVRENPGYVSFVIYITSLDFKHNRVRSKYPLLTTLPSVIVLVISFLLELFLSINLQTFTWNSLKSVTLGHLFMTTIALVICGNKNNIMFQVIQFSLILLSLQILYALKYRSYVKDELKKLCFNSSVTPEQQYSA